MTPTTKAGRALFTDMDPMDMWESNGVTPEDIAAIEAEAAAAERARLAEAVREQVCECKDHSKCRDCHRDGENLASRVPTWFVLDLLEPKP